jgi:hypothetical protein
MIGVTQLLELLLCVTIKFMGTLTYIDVSLCRLDVQCRYEFLCRSSGIHGSSVGETHPVTI